MTKKFFIVLPLLVSMASISSTLAEDQKDRTGGGAADLLNVTKFNPESAPSKGKVQLTTGCTDAQGKSLTPEDPGYKMCLSEAAKSKSAPGAQGSPAKASVGFTIGK